MPNARSCPHEIAAYLIENEISPDHPAEVWENLTGAEAAWRGTLAECLGQREFSKMSIMLIRTRHPMPSQIEPPEGA